MFRISGLYTRPDQSSALPDVPVVTGSHPRYTDGPSEPDDGISLVKPTINHHTISVLSTLWNLVHVSVAFYCPSGRPVSRVPLRRLMLFETAGDVEGAKEIPQPLVALTSRIVFERY